MDHSSHEVHQGLCRDRKPIRSSKSRPSVEASAPVARGPGSQVGKAVDGFQVHGQS